MKRRITAASALLCLVAGCASIEGTYTPDCIAYSGNEIELDGGRFVWDKFTDQVLVNDAGEVVDQYPEYPLRGRYRIEDETIYFDSYTGESLPSMHLRQEGGRTYLLTDKQHESWLNANERPRCPLVLGGRTDSTLQEPVPRASHTNRHPAATQLLAAHTPICLSSVLSQRFVT